MRQDETRCTPEAEFGDVRADVGRDETGYTPSDERPWAVQDDPRYVASPARQDEGVEAVRDETSDAVRDEGQRAAWDAVHDEVQLALRWTARVVA